MATPTTLADRSVMSALFPEDVSPRVYYKLHGSGNVLSSQTRQCVLNVYSWMRQYQETNVVEVVNLTAAATGTSVSSVYEIKRGFKRANGAVKSPSKECPKFAEKRKRISKHDACTLTAVRSCLHSFFRRGEIPTLKKIAARLQEHDVLPSCSRSTLYRLLKDMGFEKQKRNRNSFLIEREDIVEWRRRYLRAIGKHRAQNRKIYFQDETWVNAGLTVDKVWTDSTIKSAWQAFMSGLTTGLKVPSGKGERVIVTHAGSDTGFMSGCLDVFRGKKKGDYHDEMDSNRYGAWFLHLLDHIEPNSVIVIYNAPYHSRKAEAVPTTATKKGEIQQWLSSKNLDWTATIKKKDLLSILATVKHRYTKYKVDVMATDAGHTVLRLPPYHCELNPIELIWARVKQEVASKNITFKPNDAKRLLREAVDNVTAVHWHDCVEHVKKMEAKFRECDVPGVEPRASHYTP
ncbi:uncharacterized protein LOC120841325 [Ixodes scapularis]|uniref:uncharacterized protein LOC120841325 n=1 Tax=Ixodes scapularis TaxID=6945 RepID=UPI001A9D42C8|nr:uncharacterized protein LOC120841325 [Ixodes scapularis]